MAKLIQFEGQTHQFPDDFSDADIQRALSSVPPAQAAPAQPPAPDSNIQLVGTTPATPTAPARVVMDTTPNRPMSVLPTSVGGAVRDFQIGSQGVGRGLVDVATGPFDLVAGAQNAIVGGLNKVLGPNLGVIPYATPASQMVDTAVDKLDLPFIDREDMSNSEKLAYDMNRFGTQGTALGTAFARRAPQIIASTAPSPTFAGKVADTFARPYAAAPGVTVMGDAIGGLGAGVGANAAEKLPDEAVVGGRLPKQAAEALAPIAGAVGANSIQGLAMGIAGALRNAARRAFVSAPAEVPLNPQTHAPYSTAEVDRAARDMQAATENPALAARTIRENADELANPVNPGEIPVEPSQMPTAGLLSQEPGLVRAEQGARLKKGPDFVKRDANVKEAAADRVASLRDEGADLGSVMRRAGEARAERMAPVEQRVGQFEDLGGRVDAQRRQEGAAFTPIANSNASANASRRLDTNIVDENYIPARTEKNRQFDEAPGRAAELPADDIFTAIDRVRRNANGLAPGTLPNDFMRRLDELRPVIDPESGANVGGPGTAGGGDLADLRKFIEPARQRAQQSGNFDLADNLAALKSAINRTIEAAPGYAEANANYRQFAERFRPEPNDEAARFTREIDRGGQQPDGTLNRGSTPPSETAGRFLSSPEKAQALTRIMEGAPNEAAGRAAVRDYMMSDFATSALNPDGTLNAIRARGWVDRNADVLAQFPQVRQEFDRIVQSAQRGEQLASDVRQGLNAARENRRATEVDIERGAVGTLLKDDPRDVASKVLNGGYGAGKQIDEINNVVKNDQAAARGWKAAVAEVLTDRVTSTRKVGESYEVQYARLAKEFKDNEEILAKVFTPEEMNTLRQGHKLLEYFKEADKRAVAGSQTAERASIPGWLQLGARALYGDLKGGGIIKRFKLLIEQLPSSKSGADDIVHAAWFDPNLAAFLLERKLPNPNATFNNVPLRRLLGAANAARESGPDDE
ncbi:hypothetical protein [Bradyrhizobium neotropicale]|uniref:hypothetical protein n=1 Tax=Bradyrhizobium neotropicale TaxID=1497615 RepID=UPI001AD700FE|nr:hypothetical protein [Bradyrhizobium neotropicale]MBO4228008.1 hypothetical protein [Bradyrhizobium neotropicale]